MAKIYFLFGNMILTDKYYEYARRYLYNIIYTGKTCFGHLNKK